MGLGGLHKDSILNLAALAEEERNNKTDVEKNSEKKEQKREHVLDEIETEVNNSTADLRQLSTDYSLRRLDVSNDKNKKTSTASSSVDVTPSNPYYTGFDSSYDDMSYNYDPYAPIVSTRNSNGFDFLACLFPFCIPEKKEKQLEQSTAELNASGITGENNSQKIETAHASSNPEDPVDSKIDDSSRLLGVAAPLLNMSSMETSSKDDEETAKFGAPLTETERRAVVARLRLSNTHSEEEKKEAPNYGKSQEGDNEDFIDDLAESTKSSSESEDVSVLDAHASQHIKSILKKGTSSIEPNKEDWESASRRSLFSGVAYESKFEKRKRGDTRKNLQFAPMAKVVVIPGRHHLLERMKREIWWSRSDYEDFKKAGRMISKAILEGGSSIWLSSKSGFKFSEVDGDNSYGNKWWCKFGHSRRGLEHIASIEEGRHRQQNVSNAIRTILGEQTRQRIYNKKDEERLSKIASKYTNFARDLALAAGKADADAIRTNFRAKSRVHYKLLPQEKAYNEENVRALDEFTVRRVPPTKNKEIKSGMRDTSTVTKKKELENETRDNVIDDKEIAKKAAGFGTSENNAIGFIERSLTVKSQA